MAVLDAIRKEVGEDNSTILNMDVVLKELGKAMFSEGFRWIQRKMKLVTKILEKEEEILQGQEYLSNLSSEVIQGKIESKAQVKMRYQDLNKKIKEAEVDIENYGKLQVADDGSIETKRIFYFVKVIANWEDLNESDGLTSKQLSTWVSSNNPKAYLTSLTRKVCQEYW